MSFSSIFQDFLMFLAMFTANGRESAVRPVSSPNLSTGTIHVWETAGRQVALTRNRIPSTGTGCWLPACTPGQAEAELPVPTPAGPWSWELGLAAWPVGLLHSSVTLARAKGLEAAMPKSIPGSLGTRCGSLSRHPIAGNRPPLHSVGGPLSPAT